jgi:radical SAM protein with 4Fe4S-binding SPASM domain
MPNLKLEEVLTILEKLKRIGVIQLAITGGEPLGRKDIPTIVRQATEQGMFVTLITNGLIGSESLFTTLMEDGLAVLAFSLDGAHAETHEAFRKGTSFAKVIERIKLAVRIRNQHGFPTRINTSTVIQRNSVAELPEIADLTEQLGVDHASYQPVWPTTGDVDFAKKFGFHAGDHDTLHQARDLLLQIPNANLQEYIRLLPDFYLDYEKVRAEIECFAGRAYVFVDYKGDLYPCTTWERSFGSLLHEDPHALLNGPRAKQIFTEAAEQKVCGGCSLTCHQERNIMLNRFTNPRVLRELLTQRFTQRAE